MLNLLRRHRRFVLVVALTVIGLFAIYTAMVPSARSRVADAQGAAVRAQHQIIDVASDTMQSIPSLRQGASLTDTIASNRRKVAELDAQKDGLLRTLAYQPPQEFRLPEDFEPEQPAGYQRWFDRLLRELQDEFRNDPAYAIVREPNLGAAGLLNNLGFETYIAEAPAWAGVVEPATESRRTGSPFLVRGPVSRSSPAPPSDGEADASDEDDSPEAQAARELTAARADVRMKLVLMSIIVKVIQAGFVEDPLRISRIRFAERGRETAERYRVNPRGASFFRPIRVQVVVEASEPALMAFLKRAIDPGEQQQFLSLDTMRIIANQALLAEPESDRITAELDFLAFLIDPEQPVPLGEDEESRPGTGGRMPFRR